MLLDTPRDRASTLSFSFPLSRSAALSRLAAFVPDAGEHYATGRSESAVGPGGHDGVSRLSAAIRRRLIAEDEVAGAVIRAHGANAAAIFLRELCWRSYWKGWLEQHPQVWGAWKQAVAKHAGELPGGYDTAVGGETGIDAFDAWARELRETGYLHNWARMQVASIWIFTLQLPWELGAAWMYRHLLDADPASNTLSWRWVAGLHTQGKIYLADRDLIRRRSGGRFNPKGLATTGDVPRETVRVVTEPMRTPLAPDALRDTLLLLTPEDLSLECQAAIRALPIRGVVACRSLCDGPADIAAVADGLQRGWEHWRVPIAWVDTIDDVAALAAREGAKQIVTGYAPIGPVADALGEARGQGIAIAEHHRAWDMAAWPHCTRGFFTFAKQLPALFATMASEEEGLRELA